MKSTVLKDRKKNNQALNDLKEAIEKKHIFLTLGWQDIATRYRRSRVGAFWLTINMLVLIAVLASVFGTLFQTPLKDFLPHLSIGIVIWFFISNSINESCTGFIDQKETILQISLPLSTYILRIIWKNIIISGHNLIIIPPLIIILIPPSNLTPLISVIGLLLLLTNLFWISLCLAIICSRYRDFTQIIANILQAFFYLTPIIWNAELLPDRISETILNINPFYHLINIVRAPLLGDIPSALNWLIAILLATFGWVFTIWLFNNYHKRVAFWL